jgi:hypothetical protein
VAGFAGATDIAHAGLRAFEATDIRLQRRFEQGLGLVGKVIPVCPDLGLRFGNRVILFGSKFFCDQIGITRQSANGFRCYHSIECGLSADHIAKDFGAGAVGLHKFHTLFHDRVFYALMSPRDTTRKDGRA